MDNGEVGYAGRRTTVGAIAGGASQGIRLTTSQQDYETTSRAVAGGALQGIRLTTSQQDYETTSGAVATCRLVVLKKLTVL